MLARTLIPVLLAACRFFQQSMRNTLANVVVFMALDMPITNADKGTLLSMIPLGYFLTQVPGGALADVMGAKNVITLAMTLSAVCCLVLPTAFDVFGKSGLFFVLFMMGVVQGPLFPVSSVFLAKWCPQSKPGEPDEKAWATSMLDVGISVGTLAIVPFVSFLATAVGWRHTYHLVGAASAVFVVVWQIFAASTPSECWYISAEEKAFLEANVAKPKPKPAKKSDDKGPDSTLFAKIIGMPWQVASNAGLWAVFLAHMAFNFGAYYLTNWSPTYYNDVLGVAPKDAYLHLMMPHFTNLAAKALNPSINGMLARNGFTLLGCRKAFTCTGYVLAASLLIPVYSLRDSVWMSTLAFSLVNAAFGLAPSGFKANYLDITESYVGIISGYGNTLGTVASFFQPKLIAYLLETCSTLGMTWKRLDKTCPGTVLSAKGAKKLAGVLATGRMTLESAELEGFGISQQLTWNSCISGGGGVWYMPAVNAWPLVLLTVGCVNATAAIFYFFFATVHPIEKQKKA